MLPPLARRFVAGETGAGAFEHARRLETEGIGAIFNLLGEHYRSRQPADADAAAYRSILADVASADARACVSVKPTQLGLSVDEDVLDANLSRVVGAAADVGGFVWVDMEAPDTVDATLEAVEAHAREGRPIGVAIQANLTRTAADLERLVDLPVGVRLVKGAYDPPPGGGLRETEAVDAAYRDHLEFLFANGGHRIAVGTHDPAMIDRAGRLSEAYGVDYEVQMLMGVREEAQRRLAAEHDVWQYVPYGERWLSYFYRRLAERRENVAFAARALVPWL